MARSRQQEVRDRQINIKLTAREFEAVCKLAAAQRMRPVDFGRARMLAEWRVSEITVGTAPHHDPLFRVQLSRLGNNLNQIVRHLHSSGEPAPPTLEPLLHEIRTLISRSGRHDR